MGQLCKITINILLLFNVLSFIPVYLALRAFTKLHNFVNWWIFLMSISFYNFFLHFHFRKPFLGWHFVAVILKRCFLVFLFILIFLKIKYMVIEDDNIYNSYLRGWLITLYTMTRPFSRFKIGSVYFGPRHSPYSHY